MMQTREGRLSYTVSTDAVQRTERESGDQSEHAIEERRGLFCQIQENEAGEPVVVYYTETDVEGGATENTLEFLAEGRVRLTRSGALSAVFSFFVGEQTEVKLCTPYGETKLTVKTEAVTVKKEREQIGLFVCYRFMEAPEETHEVRYTIGWKKMNRQA